MNRRSARGLAGLGPLTAPAISAIGLVVVAVVSFGLLSGNLPSPIGGHGGPGGGGGPVRTPTPTNIVVVDPRNKVPGSVVYAKSGNIWIQSGSNARQLTTGGHDSMPAWSPDGSSVYFIRTTDLVASYPAKGVPRTYALAIPTLMRIGPGGGTPQTILDGTYRQGSYMWSFFLREPSISPDGTKAAIISDGPNPNRSDVVLQVLDLATAKLTAVNVAENVPLGHQDPAWSPDGSTIAYVRNGRDGSKGSPVLVGYDVATGKSRPIAGPGYIAPAWSPDGKYIAATRTDGFGTDIVVLEVATGIEVLRVTTDGRSFKPGWSPAGDALVYLHIDSGVVDLRMVRLTGSAPKGQVGEPGEPLDLTIAAGLDAASAPGWYIPRDQLPAPTPTPTPTPVPTSTRPAITPAPSS